MEMVTAAALALVFCGCFCGRSRVVCRNKKGNPFTEKEKKGRGLRKWLLPVFVLLLPAAAGFWRAGGARTGTQACLDLKLDGCQGRCVGIVETLTQKNDRWEAVLRLQEMELDETRLCDDPARTLKRLLVYVDVQEGGQLRVGASIEAEGRLQAFDAARNPGQFDFQDYYRAKKLFYRMSARRSERLDDSCDWLGEALFQAADHAGRVLDKITDEEAAGIFRAALLGDKTGMDTELLRLYRRSGVAHLLAISGLHLSLISLAVYGGLRKSGLGFGRAGLIGGAVLLLYARMTGMTPSIQRALVMALCGYLAAYMGRTYDLLSALALAAVLLCWDNPYVLTQAGVQLSFGAVLGIGAVAPQLVKMTQKEADIVHPVHPVRQTLSASMGIQLMTMPLILYHFFQLPLYGMVLNLLVVPLMGLVLFSGAAGILLGSVSIGAGRFAAGSGCWILALYRQLCQWFALLPGANLVTGRPALWQLGAYYGVMTGYLLFQQLRPSRKGLILRAASLAVILLPLPVGGLQVTFLDVGQGDGICMETASGVILTDGGSGDEASLFGDTLEPFLKSRGITVIDYAVVSHGDQDHINGLTTLLQSGRDISVRNLVLPAAGKGDAVYHSLEQIACEHGVRVFWMGAGDSLKLGRLSVECLYPGRQPTADRNEHSLVLRVEFLDFSMLLTGDMTAEGEGELLHSVNPPEPVHVLKVAHHGSKTSTSSAWLDALRPVWAVISCGRENRYGHPHREVLDALEERDAAVWTTAKSGAVILNTDGRQIRWRTFLEDRDRDDCGQ